VVVMRLSIADNPNPKLSGTKASEETRQCCKSVK
jgi:hypothetical protein